MLNPKHRRYAGRLAALIAESKKIAALERNYGEGFTYIKEKEPLNAWLVKTASIIATVFGLESQHWKQWERLTERPPEHSYEVKAIEGLLTGALDDLENGFLVGQEFLIAGEVFDSILEEAKHLLETGHKDAAAVLMRVVLEDALKRIARQESIDEAQKASKLNDDLRKASRYGQPRWRQIQAWLDLGNSAAHGQFDAYDDDMVKNSIEGVAGFMAADFVS